MRAFLASALPDATARSLAAGLSLYAIGGLTLAAASLLRLAGLI